MLRSLRFIALGLALLAAVALCGRASAQERKPGGRPPMMGGGGPGGMSSSDSIYGRLLRSEKVQKELDLAEEQTEKLKDLGESSMAKMRELFPNREAMQNMSDEQRQARFAEVRTKMESMSAEQKKAIFEVLLPKQIERLKQIAIQVRGTQALGDKEVQSELGITEDQKAKLLKVQEDAGQKMRDLFQAGGGGGDSDREARRAKFQALQKQIQDQAMAVLTADQKDKLEKLKGAKIDIDPSELYRGGPGGRGGRGGPGGPGPKPE